MGGFAKDMIQGRTCSHWIMFEKEHHPVLCNALF
jgi:hypothetical protein